MLGTRILKASLAVLVLGGTAFVATQPAEAGASTGTWRNGMVEGPYGPGYYGPDRGPHAYYREGYRGIARDEDEDCYTVRRRFVDDWGRVIVRRERICD
ncbi:hypothetical protein [Microvirga sp. 17 mud 1-3]|uniref:hypothetical protein n=1 Tax=Microvirga sp. 17 mud 1-3 TaxID=2082949 RepID=UPI000D6BDACD|nr:hypothetical protein [Microvirga sp. 17 mud 1-3]AWM86782.1 hypothetical protein C4E04_08625 [Microvirga sp. 17 mud 1-3]